MEYINPPARMPRGVRHCTFFSKVYGHEIGYCVYLPKGYEEGDRFPVLYHLHGWTGSESSEIWAMEPVYADGGAIVVFPNSSPVIEDRENLPVEDMLISELFPLVESQYRTIKAREGRMISGFSMGGSFAFYLAVKHYGMFAGVTAYAGAFHHFFEKDCGTPFAPPEKAAELYIKMIQEERYLEEGHLLNLIRRNADVLRGNTDIVLHTGTQDELFCENEIVHLYMDSLSIPHTYRVFDGVGHNLEKIILPQNRS